MADGAERLPATEGVRRVLLEEVLPGAKAGQPAQPAAEKEAKAMGTLLLLAMVWGASAPGFRGLFEMEHAPGAVLVAALANAVAFATLTARCFSAGSLGAILSSREGIAGGVELGLWFFAGDALCLGGIARTSATHAAFLGQLTCLLVPSLQALRGAPVGRNIWGACCLALAGCAAIGVGGGGAGDDSSVAGDALCLAAAFCFSGYSLRLNKHATKAGSEVVTLWSKATQAACAAVVLAGATCLGWGQPQATPLGFLEAASPEELAAFALFILFNGTVSRGLCALWEAEAYEVVSPSQAEVVFATVPLWSLLFAVNFLGEPAGERLVLGASLSTLAFLSTAQASQPPASQAPATNTSSSSRSS